MIELQRADDIIGEGNAGTDQASTFFDDVQKAVDEKGFERVTQDDIIRYSGVPRTTLYRRYGNRDEILTAFVLNRTAADIAECRRLAASTGSFLERFEEILVFSILAAHRHRWLQRELERGSSSATQGILSNAFELSSEQTLVPALLQAKSRGICRCTAPLDELRQWLLHQIFNLSRQQYSSADDARRVVRTYILPVLALDQSSTSVSEKIDFIYQHIQDCVRK
ncbi:hypothetical protein GCM10009087_49160 [Sphingomonas oligophenolica]|uniref:TetR/AcrR family transcriptional regulator n=1 Tax=Sphingomonas oligophenolica TaxID=301154 RepID=A0ABU9YA23_9SPHN